MENQEIENDAKVSIIDPPKDEEKKDEDVLDLHDNEDTEADLPDSLWDKVELDHVGYPVLNEEDIATLRKLDGNSVDTILELKKSNENMNNTINDPDTEMTEEEKKQIDDDERKMKNSLARLQLTARGALKEDMNKVDEIHERIVQMLSIKYFLEYIIHKNFDKKLPDLGPITETEEERFIAMTTDEDRENKEHEERMRYVYTYVIRRGIYNLVLKCIEFSLEDETLKDKTLEPFSYRSILRRIEIQTNIIRHIDTKPEDGGIKKVLNEFKYVNNIFSFLLFYSKKLYPNHKKIRKVIKEIEKHEDLYGELKRTHNAFELKKGQVLSAIEKNLEERTDQLYRYVEFLSIAKFISSDFPKDKEDLSGLNKIVEILTYDHFTYLYAKEILSFFDFMDNDLIVSHMTDKESGLNTEKDSTSINIKRRFISNLHIMTTIIATEDKSNDMLDKDESFFVTEFVKKLDTVETQKENENNIKIILDKMSELGIASKIDNIVPDKKRKGKHKKKR